MLSPDAPRTTSPSYAAVAAAVAPAAAPWDDAQLARYHNTIHLSRIQNGWLGHWASDCVCCLCPPARWLAALVPWTCMPAGCRQLNAWVMRDLVRQAPRVPASQQQRYLAAAMREPVGSAAANRVWYLRSGEDSQWSVTDSSHTLSGRGPAGSYRRPAAAGAFRQVMKPLHGRVGSGYVTGRALIGADFHSQARSAIHADKRRALIPCRFNVGTPSQTVAQH